MKSGLGERESPSPPRFAVPSRRKSAYVALLSRHVCRAYRAPELVFASRDYDPFAIDLWALGCTLSELFRPFTSPKTATAADDSDDSEDSFERAYRQYATTPEPEPKPARQTLFDASLSDFVLAASIFRVLGTPTLDTWPVRRSPFLKPRTALWVSCSLASPPSVETARAGSGGPAHLFAVHVRGLSTHGTRVPPPLSRFPSRCPTRRCAPSTRPDLGPRADLGGASGRESRRGGRPGWRSATTAG